MTYMGNPQPQQVPVRRSLDKNTPVSLGLVVAFVAMTVAGLGAIGSLLWAGSGWSNRIETRLLALEKQLDSTMDSRWRRSDAIMAWKTLGQLNPNIVLPPIVEE